jgi:uncharacterized membrane protein
MKKLKIYCCNYDKLNPEKPFLIMTWGWYWVGLLGALFILLNSFFNFHTWHFLKEVPTSTLIWRFSVSVMVTPLVGVMLAFIATCIELLIRKEYDYLIGFIKDVYRITDLL